jgi:hypothetical protein
VKRKRKPCSELREVSDAAAAAYQDHQQSWRSFSAAVGLQIERTVLGTHHNMDTPLQAIWGRRSGQSALVRAEAMRHEYIYGDNLPEPEPPDSQLVAEACDPATPPERLAELDARPGLRPYTSRNPNLSEPTLCLRLRDGEMDAWLNPSAAFALLTMTAHQRECAAFQTAKAISFRWWGAPRTRLSEDPHDDIDAARGRWQVACSVVATVLIDALPRWLPLSMFERDREVLQVIGRVMGWCP